MISTNFLRNNREGGFIKIIIIIVVIIVLLTIFKINLKDIFNSPTTADNWEIIKTFLLKTWDIIVFVWQNYIKEPVVYVWNEWFIDLIFPTIKNWLNR